jgi:hypothetical protein
VWRVTRESMRKDILWRPVELWTDAIASWKDADTIVVEYTRAGDSAPRTIERPLAGAGWSRVAAP